MDYVRPMQSNPRQPLGIPSHVPVIGFKNEIWTKLIEIDEVVLKLCWVISIGFENESIEIIILRITSKRFEMTNTNVFSLTKSWFSLFLYAKLASVRTSVDFNWYDMSRSMLVSSLEFGANWFNFCTGAKIFESICCLPNSWTVRNKQPTFINNELSDASACEYRSSADARAITSSNATTSCGWMVSTALAVLSTQSDFFLKSRQINCKNGVEMGSCRTSFMWSPT